MKRQLTHKRRHGFTLVEILIVVVIIGMLLALLIPAVSQARMTARVAHCKNEVMQLDSAITSFSTRFGVEPPSRITICESPADWATNATSKAFIRRCWPQFDFNKARDLDNDGSTTKAFTLDAAECLVFFLGGAKDTATGALVGFSANPSDPFTAAGSARVGPFFEFDPKRLTDKDTDKLQEYHDIFGNLDLDPIVYYSSYEGKGYLATDKSWGMAGAYQQGSTATSPFYKAQSHQIIAPGFDGILGENSGGPYDSDNAAASLAVGRPTPVSHPSGSNNWGGAAEYDNITNFSRAQLNK